MWKTIYLAVMSGRVVFLCENTKGRILEFCIILLYSIN